MNGPTRDDDGVPHDAWLREALRHAPDADAAPPPALSDRILREARAAAALAPAAPPRPASWVRALLDVWVWLARPPVAAGFASMLLAGVVGLMWWDKPLDEMLPPREGPPATTPPPSAVPSPSPPAAEQRQAEPVAPAQDAARAPAPATRPTLPTAPRERAPAAKRSEPAPRVGTTEAPAAAPAPTPSPAVTPQASADRAAAGAAPGAAAEAERSSERRQLARDASEPAAKAAAPSAVAAPRAPAAAFALRRDAAGAAPIGPLRAAIAAEPGRWSWQRDTGARAPLSPALTQWLRQLDEATRGHWQAASSGTSASDAGPAVALWRDDRPHGRLRLDATGVTFEPAGGGTAPQRAALSAADAGALREALDQATR